MNDTMTYADSFAKSFAMQSDFLAFLREMDNRSHWKREAANSLQLVALQENDPLTRMLRSQYGEEDRAAIIDDTMENTGLLLRVRDEVTPVRSCALKTVLERARISGAALAKVSKPDLADSLNRCLQIAAGKALLWYSDGKISAVHAGDERDYAVLEIPDLFEHTVRYLNANYPGHTFLGGDYDHATVTAVWALTGQTALVDTYTRALAAHDLLRPGETEIRPAIRLTTSNTGVSGANLYPLLLNGVEYVGIPLGNPIREEHKAGADLEKFDNNLERLFAQYDECLQALSRLLDVELLHPANALLGAMKELGIPKRLAMEAVEQYRATHDETMGDTAHSLYCAMAETVFYLQRDGASGSRVAAMEEIVARGLYLRWTQFDIAGEWKW